MTLVWTSLCFQPLSLLCFQQFTCVSFCSRISAIASVCIIGAFAGLPSWCRPRHRPTNRLDKHVNLSLADFRFHRRTKAKSQRPLTMRKLLRGFHKSKEHARLGYRIRIPWLGLPMSRCLHKPRQKGPISRMDMVLRIFVVIKSRMVGWVNPGRRCGPVIMPIVCFHAAVPAVRG
jgi:hypothetical protein